MANLVSQLKDKDEIIKRQTEENRQLRVQYEEILVQLTTVNAVMKKYDNPHVGSSADTYSKVKRQKAKEKRMDGESHNPNKSGGGSKFGHVGSSDNEKSDQTIVHTEKKCPSCGSVHIQKTHTVTKTVTDIPTVTKKTILHRIEKYLCQNCNAQFKASNDTIPGTEFGPNVLNVIVDLYEKRVSLRGIADTLGRFGINACHRTVENALDMVTGRLESKTREHLEEINAAPCIHADETPMQVEGKRACVLATAMTVFFQIKMSRSAVVLDGLLQNEDVKITCDGYSTYSKYAILQRCWAHILRETKYETAGGDAALHALYSRLKWIYHDVKNRGRVRPVERRILTEEVDAMAERYDELGNAFGTKLANAAPNLFTFLEHPEMEPTNNAAERTLRSAVLYRKVKGGLKNEKGMRKLAVFMGFYQTMRMRGMNPHHELGKVLDAARA